MDKEELKLRAQLQAKKNTIRKALKEMGILERKGNNTYDKYKYFSGAQATKCIPILAQPTIRELPML